jgi:creatinine amidohydrolase
MGMNDGPPLRRSAELPPLALLPHTSIAAIISPMPPASRHSNKLFWATVLGISTLTSLSGQNRSVRLADLTWKEAADVLKPQTIVLIPLGAASKEHGPHLKLGNDFLIAEYLTKEVMARTPVVVAPTAASEELGRDGIRMRFTDILHASAEVEKQVAKQPEGTHADEIETSMMLYIAPQSVDMSKAAKDFPHGRGPLQWRDPKAPEYSPTGIFGDATLATREKGEKVVHAQIDFILREIGSLRAQ